MFNSNECDVDDNDAEPTPFSFGDIETSFLILPVNVFQFCVIVHKERMSEKESYMKKKRLLNCNVWLTDNGFNTLENRLRADTL